MTLFTIQEAARFLRLTKRTLYHRLDIPRVRYGHRIMFVKEDLESWIRARIEGPKGNMTVQQEITQSAVDASAGNVYHRNPLFVSERQR